MYNKIGRTKVGLSSEEAPYVPGVTESIFRIGYNKIGTYSLLESKFFFKTKGKLRVKLNKLLLCSGAISILNNTRYTVGCYFVSPNFYMRYKVASSISQVSSLVYILHSTLALQKYLLYTTKGVRGLYSANRYRLTGLCRANYKSLVKTKGIIRQKTSKAIRTTGFIIANYFGRYRVYAKVNLPFSTVLSVKAVYAYGYTNGYKVISSLKQKYIGAVKVTGDLANTIGHIFYNVKGKINIAAFVQAVPKRVQEFITNKTWFNGSSKRGE